MIQQQLQEQQRQQHSGISPIHCFAAGTEGEDERGVISSRKSNTIDSDSDEDFRVFNFRLIKKKKTTLYSSKVILSIFNISVDI